MTVRVTRTFDLDAPPEDVWAFLSDPAKRAGAISVVEDYEDTEDGTDWHVKLPIPVVNQTVTVHTREVERDPPNRVKFVGRSPAFRVTGEHEIRPHGDGSRVVNTFVVEGHFPGVERFFSGNLDAELDRLERRVREATAP
ncbi:MAG: SRPBCC family protein [Halobacteriaceae archaeon]